MDTPIPVNTLLTVTAKCGDKETDFVCSVLGYGRYGIRLSLPQLLDQTYSLPSATSVQCAFTSVSTNQFLAFDSYVMGYERTEPPSMVVALPAALESTTRRSTLRLPAQLPVAYVVEGDEMYGEHTQSLDLSLGGLQMVTGRMLPKGALVSITIELPDDVVILSGAVSWSSFKGRKATTGVRFTRVGTKVQAALARYLNGLERQIRPLVPKPNK